MAAKHTNPWHTVKCSVGSPLAPGGFLRVETNVTIGCCPEDAAMVMQHMLDAANAICAKLAMLEDCECNKE